MKISYFFAYLKAKVRQFFNIKAPVLVEDAPITVPIEKKKRKSFETSGSEIGTWKTFGDLLEQLDSYFYYLNELKKNDIDSYNIFSKIGGRVLPSEVLMNTTVLPEIWKTKNKPSNGMIFLDSHFEEKDDKISPKLLYFQKIDKTPYAQLHNGQIYNLTMYYADRNLKKKIRYPASFYVNIDDQANVSAVKTLSIKYKTITSKKKHQNFRVPYQAWGFDPMIEEFAKTRTRNGKSQDPMEALQFLFYLTASSSTYANDGIRINVVKNGTVGVFNVPMTRTAYFFKDREKVVNENGRTRRIFHVTSSHFRTLSNGKQIPIRLHFKGLRKFTWNGYEITITVDGLHHKSLLDMDLGFVEVTDDEKKSKEYIESKDVGKMLKKHILA